MPRLHRGTWIVVACSEGAMILENAGCLQQPDLRLIDRMDAPTNRPPEDRRALPEVTDRSRLATSAFAAMVVGRLAREAARGGAQRLVLAASPPLLGAIRDRLDDDLRQRVVLTLPKTLTKQPLGRIVAVVNSALERAA
jgi:protein required for attachment to host cells